MASLVDLYNQAISASGGRAKISLPTETSREAQICELWYELVRDNILGTAYWPSCRKHVTLGLLATRDFTKTWAVADPAPTWKYAYTAPSDMLRPRFLTTFGRFSLELYDDNTMGVMSNDEKAILQYSFRQTNIDMWDVSLRMAITYTLAAHLVMPTQGKLNRSDDLFNKAQVLIDMARVATANEMTHQVDSVPEWIAARGYGDQQPATVYLYPYDRLNALSS